jgi:hypothetical protein
LSIWGIQLNIRAPAYDSGHSSQKHFLIFGTFYDAPQSDLLSSRALPGFTDESSHCPHKEIAMGTILIIVLILLLIGGLPVFPHSRSWGYGPSGIIGTVLIILLILVLLGKI